MCGEGSKNQIGLVYPLDDKKIFDHDTITGRRPKTVYKIFRPSGESHFLSFSLVMVNVESFQIFRTSDALSAPRRDGDNKSMSCVLADILVVIALIGREKLAVADRCGETYNTDGSFQNAS